MKQFISILIPFIGSLAFGLSVIHAADFSLSFETEYLFNESGKASVKKKFTLTNLTTANYPSEYYLELPPDATNVVAFDEEGQTNAILIEENGQKRAKIVFNQETLGFGQKLTIVLSYDTQTLAIQENNRWRLAIPGYASGEDIEDYTVSISFPASWGEPRRSIPPYDAPYYWTLSERPDSPITIDFEQSATPTPSAVPSSSALPIAVGVSVGVIAVYILFEFLRRIWKLPIYQRRQAFIFSGIRIEKFCMSEKP